MHIALVREDNVEDLLPLLRGYCDFYEVAPTDGQLLALSRSLIADPECEGFQILARDGERHLGFATVFWSWSTASASRIAIMNDLFVHPKARGTGVGEALIEECRVRAGGRGATSLRWQTATDNVRAQKLYDRVGAQRQEWILYTLETADGRPS